MVSLNPLFKKKGDKHNPSNYRGITLIPILSKIFSVILRDGLTYIDINLKLNEAQFGFRHRKNTCDPIFILYMAIQVFKKKSPLHTCCVDFAKAFNSVNH